MFEIVAGELRAKFGMAAVPVGGGGAWPGFETTRRVIHQQPGATGVEGTGETRGPGCGTRGRRRGLAGFRGDAPSNISDLAPLVWRAPERPVGLAAVPVGGGGAWPGFETTRRVIHQQPGTTGVEGTGGICRGAGGRWRGLAGLRDDAPSEARGADGSRAGRRPPAHTAAGPSGARNTRGAISNQPSNHATQTRGSPRGPPRVHAVSGALSAVAAPQPRRPGPRSGQRPCAGCRQRRPG